VLQHGFGATSIDQILERTGITKGAFFYHFKNKPELARALIERYVSRDDRLLHEFVARADGLSREPLQQYLIFLGLLEEALRELETPHPGCLVGSFMYQFREFDQDTQQSVVNGFEEWRRVLGGKLDAARDRTTPTFDVPTTQIIDNLLSLFEGGVILAKMYDNPQILAEQLRHHRNYVELLFGSAP
jgi:TetR/AcrR family transcriptional repressor of nem operon